MVSIQIDIVLVHNRSMIIILQYKQEVCTLYKKQIERKDRQEKGTTQIQIQNKCIIMFC